MSWRNKIQKSSFRGLRFYITTANTIVGRRGTLHEFPFRDVPFFEDVGRKGRTFKVNGFLYGENVVDDDTNVDDEGIDYIEQLEKLIAAFEDDDTIGTFVHPTLGEQNVKPISLDILHSQRSGGMETFVMIFAEAGQRANPTEEVNTGATVDGNKKSSEDQSSEQYSDGVKQAGPEFIRKSIFDIANEYVDAIEDALTKGTKELDKVDEAVRETQNYKTNLKQAILDNVPFMASTVALYDRVNAIWNDNFADDRYLAMRSFFQTDTSASYVQGSIFTPDRIQEGINNELFRSTTRAFALGHMCQASSRQTFQSSNQAFNRRNELLGFFATEIDAAGVAENGLQRRGLIDLRSAMVADLNAKGADLPEETIVKLPGTTSAFALSQELYGKDASDYPRSDEIINNNNIRNPLFMPADIDLVILSE